MTCSIQGVVSADEYTQACQDLIGRFKSLKSALVRDKLLGEGGAEAFAKVCHRCLVRIPLMCRCKQIFPSYCIYPTQEFGMDVPYAIDRLVTYGVPATGKKPSSNFLAYGRGYSISNIHAIRKIKCCTSLMMAETHPLQRVRQRK